MRRLFFTIFLMFFLGFGSLEAFAEYAGPVLRLPLPAGSSWGVNTVPGSYYTHTGSAYYSALKFTRENRRNTRRNYL